jgi:antirestriction protein ArdC
MCQQWRYTGRSNRLASPTWMTFRQALELNANVRKGESVTNTEQNDAGEDVERDIHFLNPTAIRSKACPNSTT